MKTCLLYHFLVITIYSGTTLYAQHKPEIQKSIHQVMVVNRERPKGWEHLVYGGRFMDRFEAMPNLGGITTKTWGAPEVIPRDTNNGIEDPKWSYWGGNTRLQNDGKYHLIVARWAENIEGGHMAWAQSEVVHAIADNPYGPFKQIGTPIGPGHNPEWYITKEGKHIIYVIGGAYIADSVDGPWKKTTLKYNSRDRRTVKKDGNYLHNNTFAQREDGSYMMVNRHGQVWYSKNGESEWNRITTDRVYPAVEAKYEDPVIWKDNVQYYLIVNDWLGRIAWHLRSKNGVNWTLDEGEAYLPGIAIHEDGTHEDWHKYERPKITQDTYGRAIAMNLAVIDTLKKQDLPRDNHSSKLIVIPLNKGQLLEVLNQKIPTANTKDIKVKIKAENGFNPHTDIDFNSLRFGAPQEVDFGKGSQLITTQKSGDDLILIFEAQGNGFNKENFAGKLLGKTQQGKLLFGFSKLPWVNYNEQILSSKLPTYKKIATNEHQMSVEIQNFGQKRSNKATLNIYIKDGEKEIITLSSKIKPLQSFEKTTVIFKTHINFNTTKKYTIKTVINSKGIPPVVFEKKAIITKL